MRADPDHKAQELAYLQSMVEVEPAAIAPLDVDDIDAPLLLALREAHLHRRIARQVAAASVVPAVDSMLGGCVPDAHESQRAVQPVPADVDPCDKALTREFLPAWYAQKFGRLIARSSSTSSLPSMKLIAVLRDRQDQLDWSDVLFARLYKPEGARLPQALCDEFLRVLSAAGNAVGRVCVREDFARYWVVWVGYQAALDALKAMRVLADQGRLALVLGVKRLRLSAEPEESARARAGRRSRRKGDEPAAEEVASWKECKSVTRAIGVVFNTINTGLSQAAEEVRRLLHWLDDEWEHPARLYSLSDAEKWGDRQLDQFLEDLDDWVERMARGFEAHQASPPCADSGREIVEVVGRLQPRPPEFDDALLSSEAQQLEGILEVVALKEALRRVPHLHALATLLLPQLRLRHPEPWACLQRRMSYDFVAGLKVDQYSLDAPVSVATASADVEVAGAEDVEEVEVEDAELEAEDVAVEDVAVTDVEIEDAALEVEAVAAVEDEEDAEVDAAEVEAGGEGEDVEAGRSADIDASDATMSEASSVDADEALSEASSVDTAMAADDALDEALLVADGGHVLGAAEYLSTAAPDLEEPPLADAPEGDAPQVDASSAGDHRVSGLSDEALAERIQVLLDGTPAEDGAASYECLVEQQRRWLCQGAPLRALILAEYVATSGQGAVHDLALDRAIIPAWLCRIVIRIADPRAHLTDINANELITAVYTLNSLDVQVQQFAVAWLCVGLWSDASDFSMRIAKNIPPEVLDSAWIQKSRLWAFCATYLLKPARNDRRPQMRAERSEQDIQQEMDRYLQQAQAEIGSNRGNYQKSFIKRFWRRLVHPAGGVYQLLQQVRDGTPPQHWPSPEELAENVEDWDDIVADYRNNILNRLDAFLAHLRDAAGARAVLQDRRERKEMVLNASKIAEALEEGRHELTVFEATGSPVKFPVERLLAQLQALESSHED